MPLNKSLKKVMVIGSGPIVIGQSLIMQERRRAGL